MKNTITGSEGKIMKNIVILTEGNSIVRNAIKKAGLNPEAIVEVPEFVNEDFVKGAVLSKVTEDTLEEYDDALSELGK